MLLPRVLELRVREAAQALDEEHHGRNAGARDLRCVVQRSRGKAMHRWRHGPDRLLGEPDERLVEEDRLDRPDALPLDVDRLLGREPLARGPSLREHRREPLRAQVALVEELLGRLDDRGHDARPAADATRGAHRAAARAARDLADLEGELGRACERVAPFVHRRRSRVGGLAAPRDAMALDAERPEDDPQWKAEALEDGALLDVQLEV